jgi:two-component system OmpR family response regulator
MSHSTTSVPFPEARVLIVDDEPEVRSALSRFLDLLGYCVEEAACGQQALKMLECAPYDVAVLDIRMPDMDGVEVMRRARKVYPGLPVVFLTGYATLESAVAAVKAHAVDYLFKPVSLSEVASAIANALQQRAQRGQMWASAVKRFLQVGPVTLDQERRIAIVASADILGSVKAGLTPIETRLLAYFMQHPGVAISCYELACAALPYAVLAEDAPGIIRPHISRLRRKIEFDFSQPSLILTVPGKCYFFNS